MFSWSESTGSCDRERNGNLAGVLASSCSPARRNYHFVDGIAVTQKSAAKASSFLREIRYGDKRSFRGNFDQSSELASDYAGCECFI